VYYGLSVLDRKPPNVLRTLADIMMQARDNNVGRISWGCRGQTEELRTYLRAYLQSTDPRVRDLALAVDRHLSGEADYGQWRRSQDEAQARVLYGSQFPAFKKTLSKGGSEERLELLRKALSEPGLLWALDDSFVDAFTACAADRDARVRNEVAVVVGSRWIWRPGDADPNAVELMLKLSHDEDQSVRYNSVYYGLSVVRPRDERVIARLREMLASGRDRNSSGRIEWGLKMTGATGSHPATPR
jgi:HEAT repeat protein